MDRQNTATSHQELLDCSGDHLPFGIAPYFTWENFKKQNLQLLWTRGDRPPLSNSLRPAEPPEERERGAGKGTATLKGVDKRERKRGEGNDSNNIVHISRS
jgi:hypothetical protein